VTPLALVAFALGIALAVVERLRRGIGAGGPEGILRVVTALALACGLASTAGSALLLAYGSPGAAGTVLPTAAVLLIGSILSLAIEGRPRWMPWPPLPGGGPKAHEPPPPPLAPRGPGARWPLGAVLVGALAAIGVSFVLRVIAEPNGHWDAFAFWNERARMLLRAGRDPDVVFSARTFGSHPDYPLHVSGAVALGWWGLGEHVWWWPAVVAGFFLAVLAAATGAWAAKERGTAAGCVAVLVLLAAPHVTACASWQYADVPLAALVALAFAWAREAWLGPAEAAGGALVLSGACAGLAAWTKNEGWVALIALGVGVVARPPHATTRARAAARFLAGAAPFALVTLAFKATLVPPNDIVSGASQPGAWRAVFDLSRYGTIALAFLEEPFRWSHWSYLFPAVLVVALLPRRGPARPGAGAAWLALLLATLAYGGVYVMTPHRLDWHLESSLHRLLLHLWPAVVVLALARAWPVLAGAGDGAVQTGDRLPSA
jgi:hypothetical protein